MENKQPKFNNGRNYSMQTSYKSLRILRGYLMRGLEAPACEYCHVDVLSTTYYIAHNLKKKMEEHPSES